VKSFAEIMREKQEKRATQINSGNKEVEDLSAAETKQTSSSAPVKNLTNTQKTKPAPARKYKFTPIVFDLSSKVSEKADVGGAMEQAQRRSLETVDRSAPGSVPVRKRLSVPETAEAASDSSVAVTDVCVEQSASVSSPGFTTETAPAQHTESPSLSLSPLDKSDTRITPVIKRQSSSSAHTQSDGSKKRRTSVDSR